MKITTIQLYEETKKKLDERKESQRESYDSVIRRVLENEDIPSMEEMFKIGDKIRENKKYSTGQVINLSHELRRGR